MSRLQARPRWSGEAMDLAATTPPDPHPKATGAATPAPAHGGCRCLVRHSAVTAPFGPVSTRVGASAGSGYKFHGRKMDAQLHGLLRGVGEATPVAAEVVEWVDRMRTTHGVSRVVEFRGEDPAGYVSGPLLEEIARTSDHVQAIGTQIEILDRRHRKLMWIASLKWAGVAALAILLLVLIAQVI